MTKRKRLVSIAAIAAALVLAASLAAATFFAKADGTTSGSATITADYDYSSGVKGVKITAPVANGKATFDYWNYIDVSSGTFDILEMKMIPAQTATAETNGAVITLRDAVDQTRVLSILVDTSDRWWGSSSTYTSVALDDNIVKSGAWPQASDQVATLGRPTFAEGDTCAHNARGFLNLVGWGKYTGFFSGTDADPLQSVGFKFADGKIIADSDYLKTWHANEDSWHTVADIYSDGFLSHFHDNYVDKSNAALAAVYTEEYAKNLFPSGKATLSFAFLNATSGSVSFALKSVGGVSVTKREDVSAPVIHTTFETKGVKDYSYSLPEITVVDNFDGAMDDYTVAVKDPDGEAVALEGTTFTPTKAGEYTLTVTATDEAENSATKDFKFNVVETLPAASFTSVSFAADESYYVHEKITFPAVQATSALSTFNGGKIATYAELAVNGEAVASARAENGAVLAVPSAGEYTARYTAIDGVGGVHTLEVGEFTAVDHPVILKMEQEGCQVGVRYEIEEQLCLYLDGEYPTDYAVFYQNGERVTVEDGGFIPTKAGVYFVRYFARVNDISVERVLRLNCAKSGWAILSGENVEVINGFELPVWASDDGDGLFVGAVESTTITYKNKLDLNALNFTADQNTTDSIIRFTPYYSPESTYGAANNYVITLTDAYDLRNKITVDLHAHVGFNYYGYVWLNYDGRTLARESESGKANIYSLSQFGALVYSNMGRDTKGTPFYLQYDKDDKAFYITTYGNRWQLLDLDNGEQVGYGKEWKGFTTGEVYVSLEIKTDTSSAVVITEIGGQSVAGIELDDTTAPLTYVTYPALAEESESLPDGKIGTAYSLPSLVAYDFVSGECDVEAKLTAGGVDYTSLISGGTFTPTAGGSYEYQLTATDEAGNVSAKSFTFDVYETISEITLSLASYDADEVIAGSWFALPEIIASGGSGLKKVTFAVSLGGETLEPDDLGRVFLGDAGEIEFEATAVDFLGSTVTETLTITVNASAEPVISVAGVPWAAFDDQTFVLPDFTATDYSKAAGEEGRSLDRFVKLDGDVIYSVVGGEASGSLTVANLSVGDHTVIYCAGTETNILASKEFTIKSVSAVSLKDFLVSYDYDDGCASSTVTSTADGKGVLNAASGNKGFAFVNPASAYDLQITFSGYESAKTQQSIDVVLTDFIDQRISVVLSFTRSGSKSQLRINGTGAAVGFDGSLEKIDSYISFAYNNLTKYVTTTDGANLIKIERDSQGAAFNGFPSGLVRVAFELRGASGDCAVNVQKIGNQVFNGEGEFSDLVGAQIGFNGEIAAATVKMNDTIVLPSAYAQDVMTGKTDVKLTVSRGSRKLIDGVAATSPVSFTFDSFGYYKVEYSAVDAHGKKSSATFTYRCRDDVPPTLTVNGELPATASVGDEITLPAYEADDNYIEANVTIYVTAPDGSSAKIFGDKVKFTLEGRYRVTYYAIDDDYNVTTKSFVVEVK